MTIFQFANGRNEDAEAIEKIIHLAYIEKYAVVLKSLDINGEHQFFECSDVEANILHTNHGKKIEVHLKP